jgi:site-specific DNA-cytosine methylase
MPRLVNSTKGLGDKEWNGGTTPAILYIMEKRQPLTVIIEQIVGFKNWIEGGFLPEEEEGTAFKEFKQRAESLGYEWTDITIQLAHMGIPQFRKRLWCIPTKTSMNKKIGHFRIPQPPIQDHPQIGTFLAKDPGFYAKVAETTNLTPCPTKQIHYAYKPHKVGTITLSEGTFDIWGDKGVSPCIRTQNRIFIAMEGLGMVEIIAEGMAV